MSRPRYRAWRFDAEGLRLVGGRIEMVEGDASVRQAILLLLSTRPGERVMRPEYGCELSRLVFSPNDDSTAGLAIHFVTQAILRWEPRVDIRRVDALANPDRPGQLDIVLEYRVRSTLHEEQVTFPLNLLGE
jgi:phage baseplate assembly protein W